MKNQVLFITTIVCLVIGFILGQTLPSIKVSKPNYQEAINHNHMNHGMIDVSEEEFIPTIQIKSHKDTKGSIDLQIATSNFTFTPQDVDKKHEHGSGHGHIYINQQKYGRFYEEWIHIPQKHLFNGANTICASLNGNNHAHYAAQNEIIESCVTIVNSVK